MPRGSTSVYNKQTTLAPLKLFHPTASSASLPQLKICSISSSTASSPLITTPHLPIAASKSASLPMVVENGEATNKQNPPIKPPVDRMTAILRESYLAARQRSFYSRHPIRDGTYAPPQTAAEADLSLQRPTRRMLVYGEIPNNLGNYYEVRLLEEAKLREALVDLCSAPHECARAAMIVGEAGTGKSTLMAQLINGENEDDGEAFLVDTCKITAVIWLNIFNLLTSASLNCSDGELEICREMAMALQLKTTANVEDDDGYLRSRSLLENLRQALQDAKTTMPASSTILLVLDDANPSDEHVAMALRLAVNSPLRLLVISRHLAAVPPHFRSKVVQLDRMNRQQLQNIVRSKFHQSNSRALFPNEQVEFFAAKHTQSLPLFANVIAGECTTVRNVTELYASLRTGGGEALSTSNEDQQNNQQNQRLINVLLDRESAEVRRKLFAFTLFDFGSVVEVEDVAILWNATLIDAAELCRNFHSRGLVTASSVINSDDEAIGYGLHGLVHQGLVDYATKRQGNLANFWQQLVIGGEGRDSHVAELAVRLHRRHLVAAILRRIANIEALVPSFFDVLVDDIWLLETATDKKLDLSLCFLCQFADKLVPQKMSPTLLTQLVTKTNDTEQLLAASLQFSCENLTTFLIERGADLNSPHLLVTAARNGNRNLVKLLLKRGVDVNSKGEFDQSPLHVAAKYGQDEALKVLLTQQSIVVDSRNRWLETPLMAACENGHRNVASLLLKKGALPSLLNKWNESSLLLAVKNDHEQIVRLLVERGSNYTSSVLNSNCGGRTPLTVAIDRHNEAMANLLVEATTSPFSGERYCMTTLVTTARGDIDALGKLLTFNGDKIDPNDIHLEAAVRLAASEGNFAVLKLFIEAEKVTPTNLSRLVALINQQAFSCSNNKLSAGHRAGLRLLLRRGANPDAEDNESNCGLLLACCHGDEETARLLLQNGANVNYRNRRGETALMATVRRHEALPNVEAIVTLLLENGADPKIVNENGESALTIVAKANCSNLTK